MSADNGVIMQYFHWYTPADEFVETTGRKYRIPEWLF